MKISKMLLLFIASASLCGCCGQKSYNLVLLGDIHYDHMALHDLNVYKNFNPKVPFAQGTVNKDGLYSWRSQTLWATESLGHDTKAIPLNEKMWKKDLPALLDNAALAAKKYNAEYLFQLGDSVQGDAGTYELHHKMLSGSLNSLTSRFDCPVLVAIGNHDTRGPGGKQAWEEIIISQYDKNIKNITRKDSNFYFEHKGDIYYFHDLLYPDLDMLEKAANIPSRYFFFISHVPVVPADESWIKNILSDDTERIVNLLLKRNAIVLSGHTHGITLSRYQPEKFGNTITQFVINSTLRSPEKQKNFTPKVVYNSRKNPVGSPADKLWKKLFKGKVDVSLLTSGSGYGILRVSDKGVFVDFHNVGQKPVTFTLRKNK